MSTPLPLRRLGPPVLHRVAERLTLIGEVARRPAGAFGLAIVGGLIVLVAFAPAIAPYDPLAQDLAHRLDRPSLEHVLGTDHLGRDLLSRLIFGTRIAFGVAVPAVLAALAVGLLLGLVAGYVGGKVDNAVIVVLDTLQAFPAIVLALALLALLGASLTNVIAVIAVAFAPSYARVARALVLALKQNPFIEAERSLGASGLRIVLVHVVPNIVAPLFILLAMDIPSAIAVEAALSFLGLGVPPATPSWGVILFNGFEYVREASWPLVSAGCALIVTTLGFTLLGETLRDVIDPRLSGVRRFRRL